MEKTKNSSVAKNLIIIIGIFFGVYNAVLFTICGFADHKATFWISYIFMNISIISATICMIVLKNKKMEARDWLLGYPFYKHCTIYVVAELICSVVFMLLDSKKGPWEFALSVQLILLAVFAVMIISCFVAKEMIEEVRENVKVNTAYMKKLLLDVETIALNASDAEVKKAFDIFKDSVRYSDPVSSEELQEIETRLSAQIFEAKSCIAYGDNAGAIECCRKASILLDERNRLCKAYK